MWSNSSSLMVEEKSMVKKSTFDGFIIPNYAMDRGSTNFCKQNRKYPICVPTMTPIKR